MAARVLQGAGTALLGLGLAGYGVLVTVIAPISTRVFYDPALQYMLASLELFRGAAYGYADHPGTPVEMLGTLWLALSYPFVAGAPEGFVAHHLAHPEQFMAMAQGFLALTSIGTCVFFVWQAVVVTHWTQALAALGLGGLFFGLHADAFSTLAIWSHASFCFLGGTLLSLAALLTVRKTCVPRWRDVLALGLACGVLTSIQLYFAAWVIGTAVTLTLAARLRGLEIRYALRRGEAVCVMAAVGFGVATLPIHDRYLSLATWVVQLSTHQDIYGRGPEGFSSPERLASNTLALIQAQPVLYAVTAAALALTLARTVGPGGRHQEASTLRAVGAGLAVQIVVLLVLVAKHPASRYLLPVAATLPVLLAVLLETADPRSATWRSVAAALGVAGLTLFAHGLWAAFNTHLEVAGTLQRDDVEIERLLDRVAAQRGIDRQSLRTLWTYGTTSQCYALWFGDWSADNVFAGDIGRLCPRDGGVDIAQARVSSTSGSVDVEKMADWDVEIVPRNLRDAYPLARLEGDVWDTDIASVNPVNYGASADPDRALRLIVRR